MDWSGLPLDYCDVFISCLDSHSDGTHSLQRIHCWDSDAMLHFSKSDEETNSSTSWMAGGWGHFQQIFMYPHYPPQVIILRKDSYLSETVFTNQYCDGKMLILCFNKSEHANLAHNIKLYCVEAEVFIVRKLWLTV